MFKDFMQPKQKYRSAHKRLLILSFFEKKKRTFFFMRYIRLD